MPFRAFEENFGQMSRLILDEIMKVRMIIIKKKKRKLIIFNRA